MSSHHNQLHGVNGVQNAHVSPLQELATILHNQRDDGPPINLPQAFDVYVDFISGEAQNDVVCAEAASDVVDALEKTNVQSSICSRLSHRSLQSSLQPQHCMSTEAGALEQRKTMVGKAILKSCLAEFLSTESTTCSAGTKRWMGILALGLLRDCAGNHKRFIPSGKSKQHQKMMQEFKKLMKDLCMMVRVSPSFTLKLLGGLIIREIFKGTKGVKRVSMDKIWPEGTGDRNHLERLFQRADDSESEWLERYVTFLNSPDFLKSQSVRSSKVFIAAGMNVRQEIVARTHTLAAADIPVLVTLDKTISIIIVQRQAYNNSTIDIIPSTIKKVEVLMTSKSSDIFKVVLKMSQGSNPNTFVNGVGVHGSSVSFQVSGEAVKAGIKRAILSLKDQESSSYNTPHDGCSSTASELMEVSDGCFQLFPVVVPGIGGTSVNSEYLAQLAKTAESDVFSFPTSPAADKVDSATRTGTSASPKRKNDSSEDDITSKRNKQEEPGVRRGPRKAKVTASLSNRRMAADGRRPSSTRGIKAPVPFKYATPRANRKPSSPLTVEIKKRLEECSKNVPVTTPEQANFPGSQHHEKTPEEEDAIHVRVESQTRPDVFAAKLSTSLTRESQWSAWKAPQGALQEDVVVISSDGNVSTESSSPETRRVVNLDRTPGAERAGRKPGYPVIQADSDGETSAVSQGDPKTPFKATKVTENLLDDISLRKPSIIRFSAKGPLNQGRRAAHSMPEGQTTNAGATETSSAAEDDGQGLLPADDDQTSEAESSEHDEEHERAVAEVLKKRAAYRLEMQQDAGLHAPQSVHQSPSVLKTIRDTKKRSQEQALVDNERENSKRNKRALEDKESAKHGTRQESEPKTAGPFELYAATGNHNGGEYINLKKGADNLKPVELEDPFSSQNVSAVLEKNRASRPKPATTGLVHELNDGPAHAFKGLAAPGIHSPMQLDEPMEVDGEAGPSVAVAKGKKRKAPELEVHGSKKRAGLGAGKSSQERKEMFLKGMRAARNVSPPRKAAATGSPSSSVGSRKRSVSEPPSSYDGGDEEMRRFKRAKVCTQSTAHDEVPEGSGGSESSGGDSGASNAREEWIKGLRPDQAALLDALYQCADGVIEALACRESALQMVQNGYAEQGEKLLRKWEGKLAGHHQSMTASLQEAEGAVKQVLEAALAASEKAIKHETVWDELLGVRSAVGAIEAAMKTHET